MEKIPALSEANFCPALHKAASTLHASPPTRCFTTHSPLHHPLAASIHHSPSNSNTLPQQFNFPHCRREIERNDRLSSFHIISSLAGGTGSGLGCAVTSGVKDSFSSKGLCMNTVVSPFSSGEVIVQDYNAALTLASLLRSSDGIVVMDNEVAVRKCKKGWRIERPKMDDVNRVMAEGLGGALKESYSSKSDEASCVRPHGIPTLVSHCVPHPSYKLLSILHVPTMPRESVEFTRDTWEGGVVGRLRQMSRTGCEVEQEIKWGVKEEMQKVSQTTSGPPTRPFPPPLL